MKPFAIGLMSGTSVDGIDAALVRISNLAGKPSISLEHALFDAYREEERSRIFAAFSPEFSAHQLGRLNVDMGRWFARAVERLIRESGVSPNDVRVIGSHGQTIAHYPPNPANTENGYCIQIGEPAVIAALTDIDVVSQFRAADMASGGQGAPLVPYFDYAMLRSWDEHRVALNIGGIANITVLPRGVTLENVIGFDTGPGNMVLDGLVELVTNGARHFDRDGGLARQGAVDTPLLAQWLKNPYFLRKPPKSTGREMFGLQYCRSMRQDARAHAVSDADLVRTATALVAESIARGIGSQISEPIALIGSGGGIKNPVLMEELQNRARLLRPWESATAYGIPSDFKEAVAFALFAWQFSEGLPTNVPRTTGAKRTVMQGSWTPARPGTKLYVK
ncbi:MAG: anhydro-N-acetylmuramic acid kinase [Thermaerobacter sp.]|nr:anhydro-N-acetylmuramic acid kinase [Thermaerobacter sp.]